MTTIRPTALRPISSLEQEDQAFELFFAALYDDPDGFFAIIPDGAEPKPIALSSDASTAEFEIYAAREITEERPKAPIDRVIVQRSAGPGPKQPG